eukprot:SAG31_NODE_560_length_14088_cov_10.467010_5_plen_223_part_00
MSHLRVYNKVSPYRFDANWAFSIPPPNVHYGGSGDGSDWEGMSNRVWGSHVYYETVAQFNKNHPTRQHTAPMDRPLALTKCDRVPACLSSDSRALNIALCYCIRYADNNMHPGLVQHQHPAQHRYPVWWTGDGVNLEASVESMVDSGLYDFKPYVHRCVISHENPVRTFIFLFSLLIARVFSMLPRIMCSDCGGDYRPHTGGDLLRWTAHCAFGSILRFHGR